ncbi:MAG: peptidoglycan-binding protein [Verrucomicrobiales bacterium]|nr:peptidoglycan-binding protein [Verrucomicrobiales bacterium]
MSGELNFEAMPFEAYDGTLASEQSGFELEEEFGRGARSRLGRQRFAPRVKPQRPQKPPFFPPGGRKKPPVHPPHFPPFPPWWPRGGVGGYPILAEPYPIAPEPYGATPEPYPAEPLPAGSEYLRWVQSALNTVLGLRLPVHGIADPATRSAIRNFQQREGLPVDGVVGPDTERALLAARGGGDAPMSEFEWGAHEFEVAIPRTIHRLDCTAGCPGGLTEAQCAPIVSRAISAAIKLANNAADKTEAATKIEPSKRDSVAKETARLFKAYFGHDPSKPISYAGHEPSGVSIANRFRAVAKELAGGRRFVFRCVVATCPAGTASTAGDATHPPCCRDGSRAFVVVRHAALRNVVHLCTPFFDLPEASRGGTILHELLHLRYPDFLHHRFRRANAHCFKAFALRVGGHGRDFSADCQCWEPAELNECRRRLGLPPV